MVDIPILFITFHGGYKPTNITGGGTTVYVLPVISSMAARTSRSLAMSWVRWRTGSVRPVINAGWAPPGDGKILPIDKYFSRWLKPPTSNKLWLVLQLSQMIYLLDLRKGAM